MPATHTCVPATHASMPATRALKRLRCLRRRQRCLQPTLCRACDGCGEDACHPCFPVPAVPATTTGMPATHADMPGTHDLKRLRCLLRGQISLYPAQARSAMPAWRKRMPATRTGMPATLGFALPAVPLATTRMPSTHVFPCLRGIPVALGASGAEAVLFLIASFRRDNRVRPVGWTSGGFGHFWNRNCSF